MEMLLMATVITKIIPKATTKPHQQMAGEPALLRVGGQVAGVVVVVMAAQTKRMNQLRLHQQDLAQDLGKSDTSKI